MRRLNDSTFNRPSTILAASTSPLESSSSYTRLMPSQLPSIPTSPGDVKEEDLRGSLQGVNIVIIHVKMALFPSYGAMSGGVDTPPSPSSFTTAENGEGVGMAEISAEKPKHLGFGEPLIDPRAMQERILEELTEMESEVELGVHFVMAKQGMRIDC